MKKYFFHLRRTRILKSSNSSKYQSFDPTYGGPYDIHRSQKCNPAELRPKNRKKRLFSKKKGVFLVILKIEIGILKKVDVLWTYKKNNPPQFGR